MKKVEISSLTAAPKVDPRKRRTRKMLEEAIRSLLAERPLAEVTVLDIAERADLNRATFYAHFDSKEELASAVLCDSLERAIRERLTPGRRFDVESLHAAAMATFEYVDQLPSGCGRHGSGHSDSVAAKLQDTLSRFFSAWFQRDAEAVTLFSKVPADVVATILAWSLYGGALRWSRLPDRPAAAAAARQVVDLLLTKSRPTPVQAPPAAGSGALDAKDIEVVI